MNEHIIDEKRKEIENSILSEKLILSMPDNEYKGFEWLIDILGSTKLCEANNQTIEIKYSSNIIIILDVGRSIRNRMLGDSHLGCKIGCLDSNQEAKTVCIRATGPGTATDACATFILWAENKFDDFTTPKDIKQVILDVINSFLSKKEEIDAGPELTTIVNSKISIMQEKRRQYFSKAKEIRYKTNGR
jgi:hypothetical protein